MRLIGVTLIAVMGRVVELSAAGIDALMAFTVARRRKEIGICTAPSSVPARRGLRIHPTEALRSVITISRPP